MQGHEAFSLYVNRFLLSEFPNESDVPPWVLDALHTGAGIAVDRKALLALSAADRAAVAGMDAVSEQWLRLRRACVCAAAAVSLRCVVFLLCLVFECDVCNVFVRLSCHHPFLW